jgi:hypothetical protein
MLCGADDWGDCGSECEREMWLIQENMEMYEEKGTVSLLCACTDIEDIRVKGELIFGFLLETQSMKP